MIALFEDSYLSNQNLTWDNLGSCYSLEPCPEDREKNPATTTAPKSMAGKNKQKRVLNKGNEKSFKVHFAHTRLDVQGCWAVLKNEHL